MKIHSPDETKDIPYSPIVPPVYKTSNFAYGSVSDFRAAFDDEYAATLYSRGQNPSCALLASKLAEMEGAEAGLVMSSGAGAISATIISFLSAGDHVIAVQGLYTWTANLMNNILEPLGIGVSWVDGRDLDAIKAARTDRTRMLLLESPNSLYFHLQDIRECTSWARKYGILTTLDNSYATPLFQKPHALGVDLVTHSISKYINGHSDLVAGAVLGSEKLIRQIFLRGYMTFGSVLSASDAHLILRGLRSLPARMRQIQETTALVVDWLSQQNMVKQIYHLGHESHPQRDLVTKQMSGTTGLFSFSLHIDDLAAAERFADALRLIRMAVSWGGYESLIIPLCAFYDESVPAGDQHPLDMYRLSIGLESADEIIADLQVGLSAI